jgi:hypothetical protein
LAKGNEEMILKSFELHGKNAVVAGSSKRVEVFLKSRFTTLDLTAHGGNRKNIERIFINININLKTDAADGLHSRTGRVRLRTVNMRSVTFPRAVH